MGPLIWIIDEEWLDYEDEIRVLEQAFPSCAIKKSGYDYRGDLDKFGYLADAIISQIYVKLDAGAISKLEKCKVISVYGGGYDRVDVLSANKRGIAVAFVPGYCTDDIADYVMSCILRANKPIDSYRSELNDRIWGLPAAGKLRHRVQGSRLFIIGLGRIGRAAAAKAKALKMEVSAYDPYVNEEAMDSMGVRKYDSLEDGLGGADYVSVHARLTSETEGMIGIEQLSRMKPDALLINTARGKIVREKDLVEAVTNHVISGAIVDVVAVEPPSFDEPIFHCPGIAVTPHVSYLSVESFKELKTRTAENVVKVLRGEELKDIASV